MNKYYIPVIIFITCILLSSCKKDHLAEETELPAQVAGFVRYYNIIYDPIIKTQFYHVYSKPDQYLSSPKLDNHTYKPAIVLSIDDTALTLKPKWVDLLYIKPGKDKKSLFIKKNDGTIQFNIPEYKKTLSGTDTDLLSPAPVKKMCLDLLNGRQDLNFFFITNRWQGNKKHPYRDNTIKNLEESIFDQQGIITPLTIIKTDDGYTLDKQSLSHAQKNNKRVFIIMQDKPLDADGDGKFKAQIRKSMLENGYLTVLNIGDTSSDFESIDGNNYYEKHVKLPDLRSKFLEAYISLHSGK